MNRIIAVIFASTALLAAGCATRHEVAVKPLEVKPIHITIDVNIKIDRALDDFFGDLDAAAAHPAADAKKKQ